MPTLHRTIQAASREAAELLDRYQQKHTYVVQSDNVYGTDPGYEALTGRELPREPNIVATVGKHSPLTKS